jgi:hypothetical protein
MTGEAAVVAVLPVPAVSADIEVSAADVMAAVRPTDAVSAVWPEAAAVAASDPETAAGIVPSEADTSPETAVLSV